MSHLEITSIPWSSYSQTNKSLRRQYAHIALCTYPYCLMHISIPCTSTYCLMHISIPCTSKMYIQYTLYIEYWQIYLIMYIQTALYAVNIYELQYFLTWKKLPNFSTKWAIVSLLITLNIQRFKVKTNVIIDNQLRYISCWNSFLLNESLTYSCFIICFWHQILLPIVYRNAKTPNHRFYFLIIKRRFILHVL